MTRFFDTHAHLLDTRFDGDREELIQQLPLKGLEGLIEIGTNTDDSEEAAALAARVPYIYAAVGVHPHDVANTKPDYTERLECLAKKDKVVALGEIGLDYHYDFSPRAIQREVFSQQLGLALRLGLPAIIHMREATQDTLAILREHPGLTGVMHCYSGSAETAELLLGLGLHISFTGTVTFKNAKKTLDAAKAVPLSRLMAETDCPYLSPEPVRGRRNDPSNVRHVVQRLAEIKGVSFEEMCETNTTNAKELFGIL